MKHNIAFICNKFGSSGSEDASLYTPIVNRQFVRGSNLETLEKLREGDRQKVKMARRLRQDTRVPWAWIAHALAVGTAGNAANLVRAGAGIIEMRS